MRDAEPGRLTIQAQHAAEAREAERLRKREEALRELSREIASLVVKCSRRRKPSLLRRFVRSLTF